MALRFPATLSAALIASLLSLFAAPAFAQDVFSSPDNSLLSSGSDDEFLRVEEAYQVAITPDDKVLKLNWTIAPAYYLYKDNFSFQAYVNGEKVATDASYEQGKVKYDEYFEKDLEVFYDATEVTLTLGASGDNMELAVTSQGCADAGLCYPPHKEYFAIDGASGTVTPIEKLGAKLNTNTAATYLGGGDASDNNPLLVVTLLFALLGGLILNLMPCVFPVLSIKALSFLSQSEDGHSHRVHGWVYTLGCVATFVAVGTAVALLGSSWGSQLSNPWVVGALLVLFAVMGLSLSGFLVIGGRAMGFGQSLADRKGLQGSFFTGALAVVVATPCTVPFMAPALATAFAQPGLTAILVFALLGLGMALPFLLLSYSPKLIEYLPKPGAWMETFKQTLAFPMYLTAIWLGTLLLLLISDWNGARVEYSGWLIAAASFIAFALWMYRKNPSSVGGQKLLGMSVATTLIAGIGLGIFAKDLSTDKGWQAYTPELVTELRTQGQPVFINLTAAWCITCKANERVALSRQEVLQTAADLNIALVKGDFTNEDPKIKALLDQYKRVGVPTYIMLPADLSQPAVILPQVLTPGMVIAAMQQATSGQLAAN